MFLLIQKTANEGGGGFKALLQGQEASGTGL